MTTEKKSLIDVDGVAGVNCDYVCLDDWADDFGADGAFLGTGGVTSNNLAANDEIATAACKNSSGSADTTPVAITGWVMSAACYTNVEPLDAYKAFANRKGWDDTCYRLVVDQNSAISISGSGTEYARFYGLQVKITGTWNRSGIYCSFYNGGDGRFVRGILWCTNTGTTSGLYTADSDQLFTIINSIIRGFTRGAYSANVNTMNLWNSIIHSCPTAGAQRDAGTVNTANCCVFDNGDDFSGTINISYCASDDGDGSNPQTLDADKSKEFAGYTAEDYGLVSTSVCIGNGATNPSGGKSLVDAQENAWEVPWDIGSFQYVAAGGGISIPLVMQGINQFDGGCAV